MMAIADIFEALTAVDRPTRREDAVGGNQDHVLRVKKDGHIDPDLSNCSCSPGSIGAMPKPS